MPEIAQVFHWRMETIPAGERVGSVTFIVCATVAILASLCFGGAALVVAEPPLSALHRVPGAVPYFIALLVFGVALTLLVRYYRRALSPQKEEAEVKKEEAEVGAALPPL
jgi:membrane protein implicated in regulation of membrane protease activity